MKFSLQIFRRNSIKFLSLHYIVNCYYNFVIEHRIKSRWIRLRVHRATARDVSDRLSDLSARSERAVRHQLSLWTKDLPRVRGANQGRRQAVSAVQQNGVYLLARLQTREISWRI